MSDDKILDLLISRTQTRETSTLTIVVVTASASLIFLPLFCLSDSELNWLFGSLGIIFPILGMLYREVTYRTIQNDDYNEIKIRTDKKDHNVIDNKHGKGKRRCLFYCITLLPIISWGIILSGNYTC